MRGIRMQTVIGLLRGGVLCDSRDRGGGLGVYVYWM